MLPRHAWALVLVAACGRSDRPDAAPSRDAASPPPRTVPAAEPRDQVVLRIPRQIGAARAYLYPRLDSAVWTSGASVAAVQHVLGFDPDGGSLAYVDTKGTARRLGLRGGGAVGDAKLRLTSLGTADGSGIYGVNAAGAAVRLTPTDTRPWTLTPPAPARAVVPQLDGSALVVADRGRETLVWRVRPPGTALVDTARLPHVRDVVPTETGDRVYFVGDSALYGLRGRDLEAVPAVRLRSAVRAVAPTPSGDRLYVALEGARGIAIVDRFKSAVTETVAVPGEPADFRMDPLGRYVLVRDAHADSAWVVAVGTGQLIGTVATRWRDDLPLVAPDGALLLARGDDVAIVDGATLRTLRAIAGGARDFWYLTRWTGFTPRAAGLDGPVTFAGVRRDSVADSAAGAFIGAGADSAATPDTARAPAPAAVPPPSDAKVPTRPAAPARGFIVQFASFPSEDKALAAASRISVAGSAPRVAPNASSGVTVYRVVLGPYATREDAERVGRESRHDYWVYEGGP